MLHRYCCPHLQRPAGWSWRTGMGTHASFASPWPHDLSHCLWVLLTPLINNAIDISSKWFFPIKKVTMSIQMWLRTVRQMLKANKFPRPENRNYSFYFLVRKISNLSKLFPYHLLLPRASIPLLAVLTFLSSPQFTFFSPLFLFPWFLYTYQFA